VELLPIHILNSLLYASTLFLIAGGLSLIYGVMRIVNLAHGSLYALGAYVTAWTIGQLAGGAPPSTLYALLPVGAIAVAAVGAIVEPTLLRPFYQRAEEYQLLVTFGLLLILEDVMRLVWGPYPLSASQPREFLGGSTIFGSQYPNYNLLVIGLGFLVAALLWAFVYRTRFGVILRATSQNMRMASALGLGGAFIVPIQSAVLGMGVDALIIAFVVVVIGGLGSLEGALIGALIVGFVRTLGVILFPEIELAVLYIIAAAVLLIRPIGLFGRA
jgi:branched-chain amino acid transport system permease protein